MSQKPWEREWVVDPMGRIEATDAITIETRVAFWRVPGGDAEAVGQAKAVQALIAAAPDMVRALKRLLLAFPQAYASEEEAEAVAEARVALTKAGVTLP